MNTFLDGKQKALAAAVVGMVTSLLTAVLVALQALGDDATIGDLSQQAWITIALAVIASTGLSAGAVYRVPNSTDNGAARAVLLAAADDSGIEPPEDGHDEPDPEVVVADETAAPDGPAHRRED